MAAPPSIELAVSRAVFGIDRDPGSIRLPSKGPLLSQPNPCVLAFGPGPEDATCRSCVHLYAQGGVAGRYLKCEERLVTGGPATDHRAGWAACSHYEGGRNARA